MAAVAVALDGLALTGAVRLVVALVRSVVVRGVDRVAAVLVDVALVRARVVAGAVGLVVGLRRGVVVRRVDGVAAVLRCRAAAAAGATGAAVGEGDVGTAGHGRYGRPTLARRVGGVVRLRSRLRRVRRRRQGDE